jgi:hypothetical protein
VHVLGTTITDRVRMAIRHTFIRRTVTATVLTVIRTMGGTIPGLGMATVPMDMGTPTTITITDKVRMVTPTIGN